MTLIELLTKTNRNETIKLINADGTDFFKNNNYTKNYELLNLMKILRQNKQPKLLNTKIIEIKTESKIIDNSINTKLIIKLKL